MISYFSDPYDSIRTFELLRRRMNQALREASADVAPRAASWPRASLRDDGAALVLEAEVPGMTEAELEVSATRESLTIKGERKEAAPEGSYSAHRRERGLIKFARSVALPVKIEVDGVSARVRDGILTVTMPKHADATPRSITVTSAAKAEAKA
ncbi:MAG: Hsp20/alpha crystallin family protein [Nannocystis sp.]|jgi:HSP20 family protein|nr:Hsp20/alpha crystallin family protein [Nannocystis sp.]